MVWSRHTTVRRAEIRKHRPDVPPPLRQRLSTERNFTSIVIAAGFFLVATCILMMRDQVIGYRPGQYAAQDILSRIEFTYADKDLLARERQAARGRVLRVFKSNGDVWSTVEQKLKEVPDRVASFSVDDLPG